MALEYEDPCPKCGRQGRLRREHPTRYADCYVCTTDDCPVIEYTKAGTISHEAGCPQMKLDALEERGYR